MIRAVIMINFEANRYINNEEPVQQGGLDANK